MNERLVPTIPELAPALNNLPILLKQSAREDESTLLLARALAILEGTVTSDHSNVLAYRANYAALLRYRRREMLRADVTQSVNRVRRDRLRFRNQLDRHGRIFR